MLDHSEISLEILSTRSLKACECESLTSQLSSDPQYGQNDQSAAIP